MADHVRLADTFWQRLKGLLGTKVLPIGHGLIIKPCSSIHTFGMGYAIDVLFVDGEHRIIKIIADMSPGRVAQALGSSYVVELPTGTVGQGGCSVGDILEFK